MALRDIVAQSLEHNGFDVSAKRLNVAENKIVQIDYHHPLCLLYMELDIQHGYVFNENVYVAGGHRKQGIGTRLNRAREQICQKLGLTILINNNRNPEYWQRKGYRNLNLFQEFRLSSRLGIEFWTRGMYKRFG